MIRTTAGTATTAALMTVLAACAPADDAEDAALEADTMAAPMAAPQTPPMSTTGEVSETATLSEWQIELSSDTVPAGIVTYRISNEGEYEHAFEIEGESEEFETEHIAPGSTVTLTADLQPGTYEVYCPIEDAEHGSHAELGMRTELVVTDSATTG